MYRVLIVDDEALAREGLERHLRAFPEIEIVGQCSNGPEALRAVNRLKPDVMFLDIRMPRLSGFDVVELLGDEAPLVVFVTAYDRYALKAFEAHAVDYLLKPLDPSRLEKTIARLHQRFDYQKRQTREMIRDRADKGPLKHLLIRRDGDVYIVDVADILYIEAQDDYVCVHTRRERYKKKERLGFLERRLDPALFRRLHRSYLVNLSYVQKIEDRQIAVLEGGIRLPVSRGGFRKLNDPR